MKWRKKVLNTKYPLKLILRPVSKQTTFFAMIFIEPDGCFRQVSTTLGLFEGRRTQQTTFIPKRFTKIWSKKPFFTRNSAARTFQNSKLYFCEKRASKWFERKKFAIDKKGTSTKERFLFLRSFKALFEEWMGHRVKTSLCSITTYVLLLKRALLTKIGLKIEE